MKSTLTALGLILQLSIILLIGIYIVVKDKVTARFNRTLL